MKTPNSNDIARGWISFRTIVTVGSLIGLFFFAGHLWDTYASSMVTVTKVPVAKKTPSGVKFAKIQDIQVGERAIGKNPELTDEDRKVFFPDPDPATWRKLTLEMIKPDGKRLDITLLRPLAWIEESGAVPGATIYLDLAELGAQGNAQVLAVDPCPPIKPGKANVITGTFHHEAANTIDLYIEGIEKPIGTTDNHPFWSVTKQEFVKAGKLMPGEELQLHRGETAKVVQLLPRPGPERVHNLEVMNEHVYKVAQEGVLVHNACTIGIGPVNGAAGHHIFPKQAFTSSEGGYSNGYHPNKAFVVPHAEIMKQGFSHPKMTGKQASLYAKLASEGKQPTFEDHQRIAKEALIAGGVDPKDAAAVVFAASAQVKGEGWNFTTHPWGQ